MDQGQLITLCVIGAIGAIAGLVGGYQLTKSSSMKSYDQQSRMYVVPQRGPHGTLDGPVANTSFTGYEKTGGTRHHRKKGTRRSRK